MVISVAEHIFHAALGDFTAVAFGCSAMGSEVLEKIEFEPMFVGLEGFLGGRRIALFGSYGWGDGHWMRDWFERCDIAGANLLGEEELMINDAPDDAEKESCRELGREPARQPLLIDAEHGIAT